MNSTERVATTSLALATTIILGGCASSLSGVGGTESFACQAPIGAQCTSISGVYANADPQATLARHRAVHKALRLQQGLLATTSVPEPTRNTQPSTQPFATPAASTVPASGAASGAAATTVAVALRSPPRVMRLWIAPWEDADGDLHEASFVHVVIDTGRWLIERVRPAARSRLDIATPPLVPLPTPVPAPDARPAPDLVPTEP